MLNRTYELDFERMHKALSNDPDQRPYVHEMHVTRDATDTITAMGNHVAALASAYGSTHQWTTDASLSLNNNVTHLFSLFFGNDTTITRDGELSLFVRTGTGFVYGLIFHGIRRSCTNDGCRAVINDDGTAWTYMPEYHMCDAHTLSYPLDAPAPGAWSFHS